MADSASPPAPANLQLCHEHVPVTRQSPAEETVAVPELMGKDPAATAEMEAITVSVDGSCGAELKSHPGPHVCSRTGGR